MSKYSEKKERQAKEASAEKKVCKPNPQNTEPDVAAKLEKLAAALLVAQNALDKAMVVRDIYAVATGDDKSDYESVRGKIVSARDKVASAIARLPKEDAK